MEPRKVYILGRPVHLVDMEQAVAYLRGEMARGVKQFVVAQNPEKVMRSLEDRELAEIMKSRATLLIADGVGLVLAGRILRLPRIPRVTGVGLFETLIGVAEAGGKRVFLYGAAAHVVSRAGEILRQRYPGLCIAGTQHGYERDMEKVAAAIERARPDYLFVALGSPRQEKWIAAHLDRLPVRLAMGVGGTFDVLTGNVRRAPVFMQKLGLEWLYRLLSQPARAGRMANLPRFLWPVVKQRLTGSQKGG